jgi:Cys-rich repeat protein
MSTHARLSTPLLLCLLCSFSLPASAYTVKKCDPIAENDISVAADYVDRRLQDIADEFTHISQDNRDEFVRKWPRVDIVCQDEGQRGKSRTCLALADKGGFSHGGPGNRINVCYYNLVDSGATLCSLVGVLVHEAGHAHGFPILENHNDPNNYVRNNDPVYVMGTRAEAFCQADRLSITDGPLIGRSELKLGAACRADDQCQSGRCLGGTCQCDQDGDCPSGQRCFKPALGGNFCSATDLALGASCSRDEECRSSHCEGGECVCRQDGDCPSGQVCRTPITGRNRCEAGEDGTLAVGAACQRDAQCKSGRCERDECVCRSDSDCPAGQSCYTPVTGANYCSSTTLALGASCSRDSQCRSDKCQDRECVCKKDSDCPSGQMCKKPVIGKNRCDK